MKKRRETVLYLLRKEGAYRALQLGALASPLEITGIEKAKGIYGEYNINTGVWQVSIS